MPRQGRWRRAWRLLGAARSCRSRLDEQLQQAPSARGGDSRPGPRCAGAAVEHLGGDLLAGVRGQIVQRDRARGGASSSASSMR